MSDLEALYKIREIFRRREYVEQYNEQMKRLLDHDVRALLPAEERKRNDSENEYRSARYKAWKKKEFTYCLLGILLFAAAFTLANLVTVWVNRNDHLGRMYLYASCAWVIPAVFFRAYAKGLEDSARKNLTESRLPIALTMILVIAMGVLTFVYAVFADLCTGFFSWLLGILTFSLWPLVNFVFLFNRSVSWAMLLVVIATAFACALLYIPQWKLFPRMIDRMPRIRSLLMEYEAALDIYKRAYGDLYNARIRQYPMLADTSETDQKALAAIIPTELQDPRLINKWIWCIEQQFAHDIVGARNWILQQQQNAAVQEKLNEVAYRPEQAKELREQAIADANTASKSSSASSL